MMCFGLIIMFCQPPAAPPAPPAVDTYCQNFKPIRWSSDDTRKTKEGIDTENRKWKRLCATAPKK